MSFNFTAVSSDGAGWEQLPAFIVNSVFPQTAEPFFDSLVRNLATSLGARFSFLCHLAEPDATILQPLAFWGNAGLSGRINRRMMQRICEHPGANECMVSSNDIRHLLPEDPWIWQEGIQYCVAIALRDKTGALLGHIGVLDRNRLAGNDQAKAALEFVASRVTAEIERLKAVRDLRESDEKFKSICAAVLDGVILTSATGHITFWSERSKQLFGYTPEEAIGRDVHTLLAPDRHQEAISSGLAKFRSTGSGPVVNEVHELTAMHKGGEEIPIELSISSVQLKGRWHAVGLVRDVSERNKAETALKASRDKVRRLATHLQHVREEERRTIAKEIHDELGHALTALKMDVIKLKKGLDLPRDDLHAITNRMLDSINDTVVLVQSLSSQLRPPILDDLGLVAAIEWLTEQFQDRTGIRCSLTLPPTEPLFDEEVATALFRIAQEALTNISRHASAATVAISLVRSPTSCWTLTVADDGRGVSKEEAQGPDALGILGMQERAAAFGGALDIQGVSGEGTRLSVSIPIGA